MHFSRSFVLVVAFILSACMSPKKPIFEEENTASPPLGAQADYFAAAIATATEASELSQTAQSLAEWEEVMLVWHTAAQTMAKVPKNHSKYRIAQERTQTYQENQAYARQTIGRLLSEREAQISRGKEIFDQTQATYTVAGLPNSDPVVWIVLPRSVWEQLSLADQQAVGLYAESRIPMIRANPEAYIDVSSSSVAYQRAVIKTSNLCNRCWKIGVSDSSMPSFAADTPVTVMDGSSESS